MKKRIMNFFLFFSVFFIGFLICTSSLYVLTTKALVEEKNINNKINSLDRSSWIWNTTEVVSTESTADSRNPALYIDSADNIHVAWQDWSDYASSGTDMDVFYKRWNASTSSWTTTEVISAESTDESQSVSIFVDSTDTVHVVWDDYTDMLGAGTDRDIFYKQWNSSTSSWTSPELVSTESTGSSRHASLAVDFEGNIHVVWRDYTDYNGAGTDEDIFYKFWNASSYSWNTTEVVSTGSIDDSGTTSLAVDSAGTVHIVWNDYDYNTDDDWDIVYRNLTTSNLWSPIFVVSNESTGIAVEASITVDLTDSIYIAWRDNTDYASSGFDYDIFFKYWNSSTTLWSLYDVVSLESTGDSWLPSIAVDPANTIHIVWHDYTNYTNCGLDHDIFYKRKDISYSWTITEVVSTESTGDSRHPSFGVDSNGLVHVVWFDFTDYLSSGTDVDIFYKYLGPAPIIHEFDNTVIISSLIAGTFILLIVVIQYRRKKF
ncbi:MAG: hypothetical protein ACFFDS_07380 [Candidatus Thorarchaeota archaeon]